MENSRVDEFESLKKKAQEQFNRYQEKNPKAYREMDRTMYCLAFIDGYLQRDSELLNQLKQK